MARSACLRLPRAEERFEALAIVGDILLKVGDRIRNDVARHTVRQLGEQGLQRNERRLKCSKERFGAFEFMRVIVGSRTPRKIQNVHGSIPKYVTRRSQMKCKNSESYCFHIYRQGVVSKC